jgi:hypothetical protein
MNDKTYLIVTGVIFGLSTIGELIRLIFQVPVQVGTLIIPMWPSALGLMVTLSLCIWAFRLANKY